MRQLWYLLALLLTIFLLWDVAIFYPLKILVVFFHESSHALATLLTGGEVKEMVIQPQAGGHVISAGGNRAITLTAGYLGSLAWGVCIYLLAITSQRDRGIMMGLGVVLMAITLIYISNSFALLFGLITGAAMIASGKWLSMKINDFILRVIGLTSMMYVPLDIYSDTILRSHLRSDARMFAEEFGGATIMWGTIWIVISLLVIYKCLKWSLKR
ncbi:MAG: M50 family metallopeptidase [Aliivibrio sp.]|uniref:M50 family metallopeptidase n=1 Tax=Aliivibrio sp. TaxID=1872443 RepID=UPI001A3DF982|nr:M50 family metallopeptidase [Aliivibrio sp.]